MKKTKKTGSKIKLRKTTIRVLAAQDLNDAAGGTSFFPWGTYAYSMNCVPSGGFGN